MCVVHLRRKTLGRILILLGAACWAPYFALKLWVDPNVPMLPFLIPHLCGVVPGALLRHGDRLAGRFRPRDGTSPP